MATSIGRQLLRRGEHLLKNYVPPKWRSKSSDVNAVFVVKKPSVGIWVATTGGILTAAAIIYARKYSVVAEEKHNLQNKKAVATKEDDGAATTTPSKIHLTLRERRFVKFASIEFDGQLYMSPRDFLESVTENDARPRLKRQVLLPKQLDAMQRWTPPAAKGSSTLFRTLGDNGIISYTEYLFLLSILTKPQSGFHIAFNMFDTDGNRQVDKDEFLVLTNVVAKFSWKESPWQDMVKHFGHNALERIFSHARLSRQNAREAKEKLNNPGKVEEARTNEAQVHKTLRQELDIVVVNTTLLVHFFGKKGKGVLGYEDFSRFMENLQTEVLHIEFNEFSKGLPIISELDFAKILLRYTMLHSDEYEAYLDRLSQRLQRRQGVSFEEFKAFCQFLNNLEDFGIAMRMYTLADRSIAPAVNKRQEEVRTHPKEFNRAVKICTGHSLSDHLVQTVFDIFDEDDDGQLSYKEFIAIMRNRLHRGIHPHSNKNEGWDAFKSCIKEEMRSGN